MENKIETKGRKPEVKAYEVKLWAGKIPVYVCAVCGHQTDYQEEIIEHVKKHEVKI